MTAQHYRVLLKSYIDKGGVQPENFEIESTSKPPHTAAELSDSQFLAEPVYVSVDPYMRNRFRNAKSYFPAFEIGQPIENFAVVRVLESKHPGFEKGDYAKAMVNFESVTIGDGNRSTNLGKTPRFPLSYYTGVFGLPGVTAYSSLFEFVEHLMVPGKTVLVSAAAGAVGQTVGQICKIKGMKVIGTVGSDAKVDFVVNELGFDAAINYKKFPTAKALTAEIERVAPDGIDIYYENVGGLHLEAALNNMNMFSRIIACGMISVYDGAEPYPVPNLNMIFFKEIHVYGFLAHSLWDKHGPAYHRDLSQWIEDGTFKVTEDIREGWENVGSTFIDLMNGNHVGKLVVKVGEDPFRK